MEEQAKTKQKNKLEEEDDDEEKVEFVKLVEHLIGIAEGDNLQLATLAISALVNLCNFSEDIKGIFLQKHGLHFVLHQLNSKREDIIINILKLVLTIVNKSEIFSKSIEVAVKPLLQILNGPKLPCTRFSERVNYFVLLILRQMIKHNPKIKEIAMDQTDSLDAVITIVKDARSDETVQHCVYQYLRQLVSEDT